MLHRVWSRWARRWGIGERHGGILILHQKPALPLAEAARVLNEIVGRGAVAGELHDYLKPPLSRWLRDDAP
jgi:hypothetical protein